MLSVSCSDFKPIKVVISYTNDLNVTTIPTNKTLNIKVYANNSDGTKEDVTNSLLWSSSDDNLATSDLGLVTALSQEGQVTITYETPQKLSDNLPIHKNSVELSIKKLTLLSINLSSPLVELSVGASKNITATATYEDNIILDITNDVLFASSDERVATVTNGLIKGIAQGETLLTASDDGIVSQATFVRVTKQTYVGVNISSPKTEFNAEQTISLEARGITNKNETVILNNNLVNWVSSDPTLATVDENGLATAIKKGSLEITATLKEDENAKSSLTLSIIKDEYMRLFDANNSEIELYNEDVLLFEKNADAILAELTIKAVGRNFIITGLNVTDFNGTYIGVYNNFLDLYENTVVLEDNNITFRLSYNRAFSNIKYIFKIDDDANSVFTQNYQRND